MIAGLHSVKTAAGTLHNYETISGLRFALYTTNTDHSARQINTIRVALKHIYTSLWVDCVVRSPLFKSGGDMDIAGTNFESKLDAYLKTQGWFRT